MPEHGRVVSEVVLKIPELVGDYLQEVLDAEGPVNELETALLFAYSGLVRSDSPVRNLNLPADIKLAVWLTSASMLLKVCVPDNDRDAAGPLYDALTTIQLENPVGWMEGIGQVEHVIEKYRKTGGVEGDV